MKVVHLRPKYPLEQYVIGFEFPAVLTTQPIVRVELESGSDPNPQQIAGWLFTTGNVVCVLISGGIPGCVYKLICEASIANVEYARAGLLAVKPTAAIPPPGFIDPANPELPPPVLPFGRAISSPVYPGQIIDEVAFLFSVENGDLVTVLKSIEQAPDRISFLFTPMDGELFEVSPPILDPDEVQFVFIPVDGTLKDPIEGKIDPDEVQFVFIPTNADLRIYPVGAIDPDEIQFVFIPTGGTLE